MLGDLIEDVTSRFLIYHIISVIYRFESFGRYMSDCGRLIRANECTLDKGRLDYACILISTKSLEVLNSTFVLLIDGCQYVVKLVEE